MLLREVARRGSLTVAARELSFTTSAVSQQIGKLEKEVGVALLERHPRGIRLTDAGEALLGYADRVDQLLAAARAEMDEFAGARRGQLRIGAFPTAGASLMPLFVTRFRERHPQIEVTVRSARYGPLVDMLKRRELDVTLLWDYPWAQVDDPDLAVTRLLRDPVLLLLPASHPLARKRSVALGALREEQWITRSEHPVADVLFRLCAEAGFEPRVAFAANDYQEAQGMVAAGIGICLIPRLAATVLRHDVRVVPITGDPAPRRVLLARLRDRRPTPPEAAAVEVLRSCATDLPGVEQRRPPG